MKKISKIVLAVGGTGGHIVPALAAREAFCKEGIDVLLLGKGLENHPSLCKQDVNCREIPAGVPSVSSPMATLSRIKTLYQGYKKAKKELIDFDPDLVIGFGSYHSLPVLIAALRRNLPIFLHEQNVVPGRVNKLFARFARGVGVSFSPVTSLFPCASQEVALPKRHYNPISFTEDSFSPKICIVGGSQGSNFINQHVPPVIGKLSKQYPSLHVHHIAGPKVDVAEIQNFYNQKGISCSVTPFEHDMLNILLSVDLVIGRAGATILDELFWANCPAILIPYPGAYGHQEHNARFFADAVGGGSVVLEKTWSEDEFMQHVLLALDSETMKNRREALKTYQQSKSTKSFYQFICECL